MNFFIKVFFSIILLFASVYLITNKRRSDVERAHERSEAALLSAPVNMSAESLIHSFKKDPGSSLERHKGRALKVTGKFKSIIDVGDGTKFVVFESDYRPVELHALVEPTEHLQKLERYGNIISIVCNEIDFPDPMIELSGCQATT